MTDSGIRPQLLETAYDDDIPGLLNSLEYWMQEKHDGQRVLIENRKDCLRGINRKSQTMALPDVIRQEFIDFPFCLLDGELVGDTYFAFDVLMLEGRDLRMMPFKERYAEAKSFLRIFDTLRISKSVADPERKKIAFHSLRQGGAEGVVFRNINEPYKPGRNRAALKYKFWNTASCIVLEINSILSVCVGLLDGEKLIAVGNVPIPENRDVPAVGSIVEVRYIYALRTSGAMDQPVYLGHREDVDRSECTLSQLKYKRAAC